MFYIIETQDQLQKFSSYDLTDSFVEFILQDDRMHPDLAEVSLIYIKPNRSRTGFIFPINHSEGFSLPIQEVLALFQRKIKNVTVFDAKRAKRFLWQDCIVTDLKMVRYLDEGVEILDSQYNTVAHNFFYGKYPQRSDLNRLIPICKHQEKWNNLVKDLKIEHRSIKKYYQFYSNQVNDIFRYIESNGIKIDNDGLNSHYTLKRDVMSLSSDIIYTNYNLYTATGRPSNAFNGINFAAMNKGDSSRSFIKSRNGMLIELDYTAYHPRILAKILEYTFEEDDIHSHLGRIYFNTNELTIDQYNEAKKLTFKYTYTMQGRNKGIPFFDQAGELTDYLWNLYKKKGYISSPISKKPIRGIESKTQILPYLLQNYETERNVMVINDIQQLLNDDIRLVLYSYDAFLFDVNKESADSFYEIRKILERDGFPTSISSGKNYSKMKRLTL